MWVLRQLKHLKNRAKKINKRHGWMTLVQEISNYLTTGIKHDIVKSLAFSPNIPLFDLNMDKDNRDIKVHKYTYVQNYPGIRGDDESVVIPRPSDTVVEVGVWNGYDTATFAKLSNHVIGFEPSPRNYAMAQKNLNDFENITLVNKGLWDSNNQLQIQYGEESSDDGFLHPDKGEKKDSVKVEAVRLDEYLSKRGVDEVDFLKVEAEGAEPEVLKGIGDLQIDNIVVGATAERDGNAVGKEVLEILQSKGYKLVGITRGHLMHFCLNPNMSSFAFRDVDGRSAFSD